MPGRGSIKLARVFGIRIGVHPSWFVVLFLFIVLFGSSFRGALDASDAVAYVTTVASVGLFFVSLILHELGHALAARREGVEISSIDLWLMGGVANMRRDADSPGAEARIAGAGPLVTALIAAVCIGLGLVLEGGERLRDAAQLAANSSISPALLLLAWVATMNIVLLVFNLIPAFPLDGGRLIRALVWKATGDRARATGVASALGQAFGFALVGFGLVMLLAFGDVVTGLWGVFGGWMLAQTARAERSRTTLSERLGGVTVADIMDPEPVAMPADLSLARAHDEFFLRYRYPWFPVADGEGRFVGVVRAEPVEAALASRPAAAVGEVVDPDADVWRVGAGESLESLLRSEGMRRSGALVAVDGAGGLCGVVTLEQVRRALAAGPPMAPVG